MSGPPRRRGPATTGPGPSPSADRTSGSQPYRTAVDGLAAGSPSTAGQSATEANEDKAHQTPQIGGDEPTLEDELGRRRYAAALANISQTCATPQVIGVYGSWGTGKTSLLRQIQQMVSSAGLPTVWFDPWLHQFDENPVLALVQSTNFQLGIDSQSATRTLLRSLSVAFIDSIAKMTGVISVSELREHVDAIEAEQFRRRDVQVRIMDLFAQYVLEARRALTPAGRDLTRLVFFIDDLDRCVPDKVVGLLEALKLYLSQPGCVYILGLDRTPVEAAIRQQYPWAENSKAAYLDKIIQLQFQLPPISAESATTFVLRRIESTFGTLASGQRKAADLIAAAVGTNPRQIKRVISAFALAEMLAQEGLAGEDYEPELLALTILFQYHFRDLYDELAEDPTRLPTLSVSAPEEESLFHRYAEGNRTLLRLLAIVRDRLLRADLSPYIHLVEVAAQSPAAENDPRPGRIRVYELARELGLTNKEALDLCEALGIGVRSHSSSIVDAQADRVRRKVDSEGLRRDVSPIDQS